MSCSKKQDSPDTGAAGTSTKTSRLDKHASISSKYESSNKYDEDFDDFDPRGTLSSSKTGPSAAGINQMDLFVPSFIDMFDAPVSFPTDNNPTSLNKVQSEVDLFAGADFVSATPEPEAGKSPVPQTNVDLFASQPTPAVSSPIDFFVAPDPVTQPGNDASKSDTASNIVDPFTAVFGGSNPLGALASQTDPLSINSDKNSPNDENGGKINESLMETKSPPKKEAFQVKSGIWADSLSRGLFDLNITARKCFFIDNLLLLFSATCLDDKLSLIFTPEAKKVNLADVGIVGGLTDGSEEKDKGLLPSLYMGSTTGVGSGAFTTSASMSDDDFFSSLSSQQYEYGGSQK
ncbi:clathrin interactor epsin 1 [Phtheirospermum japonicum]|uniref:Clathrin interactor epsin 1 n=1 Tax=Phtheirospermum japonicum TaxID=374723 RepID=A0A830CRD9_9LAMI|nr:clathrin interactor epsin 1 [Phtheirospermum japonicum]